MFTTTVTSLTDVGLKRARNEDSHLLMPDGSLFAVADGVGGNENGDKASQLAVQTIEEKYRYHQRAFGENLVDPQLVISQLMNDSHRAIAKVNQRNGTTMCTTLDVLLFHHEFAVLGHLGDSRIYRFRDGQLLKLTRDHTLYEHLMITGRKNELPFYPKAKHTLTASVGVGLFTEPDLKTIHLQDNDIFLMMSDGIYNYNEDTAMESILKHEKNMDKVCQALKSNCYQGGAGDNLTVIAILVRAVN